MKLIKISSGILYVAAVTFLMSLTCRQLSAQVVVQRCDVTTGWDGDETLSIDDSDKKEGNGALRTNALAGDHTWFSKSFSQTQTGIDETGYLIFWLYVSDASKLEGGVVEITSSGGPDVKSSQWTLDKTLVGNGWNFMELQINGAAGVNGGADLDSINYFRITQNLSGPVTAKIDFVRFAPAPGEPVWPRLEVPTVDNSSLDGKVMFGYQGWFNHPDDGAGLGWVHWGNLYEPISSTVDMYPDLREYGLDELYDADLSFPDGSPAPVFSSHNRNTVVRHMKWVRDYNLDGVFLQRFISASSSKPKMDHKDTVTSHVMEGCETYGRVFAIMYDGIANKVDAIKSDWMHLVDELGVTGSDRYLNHRGKPLVALWGYTVRDPATVDQLVEMIDFFKNNPDPRYRASLLLGVAWDWYDESPDWINAFRDVEVISPWFSGHTDYNKGQAWCDENNVDFLPVVHPGFSWHNLKYPEPSSTKNKDPRMGGQFLWDEVHEVVSKNAKSVYIAMFDEIDEGTAMFKLAENDEMIPREGYWLPLDEDGFDLPSDWYLRMAGLATEVVRGYEDNQPGLVTPPEGIMTIRIINEVNDNGQGGMEFIFPDFPGETEIQISIDSGATYTYATPDNAGSFTISGLPESTYQVFVRHGDGLPEVFMGAVSVGNTIEMAPGVASEPYPADQAMGVNPRVTLGWQEGDYTHTHIVYFGDGDPPDSATTQYSSTYVPGYLEPNTTYYWRVDEVNGAGRTEGPVWSFTTGSESLEDMVVLDYCDAASGWNSSNGTDIDTGEKKEGYASVISSGSGTDWFKKKYSPAVNTFCNEDSYLDLWLYVSDVSKFNGGGQIEITSSGGPDTDEYNWLVKDLNLNNGWNDLHLRIGDANVMGSPDLSAIDYFRFYQFVSGDVESRIDFIRFTGLALEPPSAPVNLVATPGDATVVLNWDDHTQQGVTGYNIYRALSPGGSYSKLNTTTVNVSEYTDSNVVNGNTYYYVVKARDAAGNESESSVEVSATPVGSTLVEGSGDIRAEIYPNPAEDWVHIRVQNGNSVRIFDIAGHVVQSMSIENMETVMDVSELHRGVYLMEVRTERGAGVYKLIIE